MTLLETFLLAIGMSSEIFAWVVCKSSDYSKIDKHKMIIFSLAFAIWEAISLLAGYYGVFILKRTGISDNAINVLRLFALVFFIVFALELLYKGIKNDPISEKRADEVHFKPLMKSLGRISIHTLFESISFSFCDTRFSYVLVIPLVSSVLVTLSALWAGYHLGFEVKSKAYIIGFVLIMLGVAETIFRFVI